MEYPPKIQVKDVLECFKTEVACKRSLINLQKCLDSFGFSEEDNIVPLYYMIIEDPDRFKDRSNYPKTWKTDSSRKAGVSSINRSINISIVESTLGKERVELLRTALSKYISDLTSMQEEASSEAADGEQYIEKIKTLEVENMFLRLKVDKLSEIVNILVHDSPQSAALVKVSTDLIDLMS